MRLEMLISVAGHFLRNELLKHIHNADLRDMVRLGEMTFELGEQGGGNLTVYRVCEIDPTPICIPKTKLGKVFTTIEIYAEVSIATALID